MNSSEAEQGICFNTRDIKKSIHITGVFTNGICIVVFSLIIKRTQQSSSSSRTQGNNMFKYLLIKSIMDFVYCLSESLLYFRICRGSYQSLACLVTSLWFYDYLYHSIVFLSIVFEIAATFDCYISINRKLKCCQTNFFFNSFSFVSIIFFMLITLIYPLKFKIEKTITTDLLNNKTLFQYNIAYSKFGEATSERTLIFVESLIFDFIMIIILLVFNVIILFSLFETTKRRRILAGNNNNNNTLLTASQNAERKKIIMIVSTGFNYGVGHFIFFGSSIVYFINRVSSYCLFDYTLVFYVVTYTDSIIFYFFFNNIFRKILIGFLKFLNRNNQ
jgi:hypothetical protein